MERPSTSSRTNPPARSSRDRLGRCSFALAGWYPRRGRRGRIESLGVSKDDGRCSRRGEYQTLPLWERSLVTQTHRRPWTLLGSFFARARRPAARKKSPRRRLYLEPLEDRTLLSASIFGSVWNDLVADAVRQSEPGLAAVRVYLDDGSGVFNGSQPSVLT